MSTIDTRGLHFESETGQTERRCPLILRLPIGGKVRMRIFKSVDIPNAIVTLGFRSSWEEDASLRFKDRIICFECSFGMWMSVK